MKLLTKYIVAIIFSLGISNLSVAQQNHKKAKQIEDIKFGYIAGRLNLTGEESQAFWPLYKEYQSEWSQIIRQKKQSRLNNASNPEKAIDADFLYDGKLLELRKKYRIAFGEVLPPEKLKALYQAERSFREELIKQLKNRP
ncbi:MAG TPA: hypothetical protein VFM79_05995 [Pelobium sp.]|nr:hypothetical protein [Pelobium sp.]